MNISLMLWIVWWAYWVISARKRIQSTQQAEAKREPRLGRLGYLGLMIAGFVLLFLKAEPINLQHPTWPTFSIRLIAGLSIQVAGLAFAIWARRTLGKNWTGRITTGGTQELVMRGPYRLVRHPIYSGLLLAVLGTAIVMGKWHAFLGFVLVVISVVIKLQREEGALRRHFGSTYEEYAQRVSLLLPGL